MKKIGNTMRDIVRWRIILLVTSFAWTPGFSVQGDLLSMRMEIAPLRVGETWRQTLVISNAGPNAMVVTNVTSSCECLQATGSTNPIAPGGVGEVEVALTPAVSGDLAYEVAAQTTAGDQRWSLLVTVTAALNVRNRAAYVDLTDLRERSKRGETYTLVDVRSPDRYEAAHLPDSINVPLAAVKTKGFLRATPVVLVDAGWGDPMLEDECQRLNAVGFTDVHILYGGLNAWHAQGGRLEGLEAAAPRVHMLGAQEFLRARGYDDWIVVAVDEGEVPRLQDQLPECVRIPCRGPQDDLFMRNVQKQLTQATQPARVLILTRDGQGYAAVAEALRGRVEATVFYLEHGLQGWGYASDVQAIAMQGSTRHTTAERTTTAGPNAPRPCGTCPGGRRP